MVKTISQDDYLRVIGLLIIASDLNKQLTNVEQSLARLLKVECKYHNYYGHVSDAVYSSYTASELLEKLEVAVDDPKAPKANS